MTQPGTAILEACEPDTVDNRDGLETAPAISIRRKPVAAALATVAVLLLIVDLVLQTLYEVLESDNLVWEQIVRLFDLNTESSLPTWFSVVLLFTAVLTTLVIAITRSRAGDPFSRHWFLFALLIAGFSMDEAAQLHDAPSREPLRDILGTGGLLYYPWVVIAVIAALVVGFLSLNFLRYLPRRTTHLLIVSALIFGGGAVGLEMASGWYLDRDSSSALIAETISSFEEFFELAGVIVLMYTLLNYAESQVGQTRIVWAGASAIDHQSGEGAS